MQSTRKRLTENRPGEISLVKFIYELHECFFFYLFNDPLNLDFRRIEVERWFCCFLIGLFTGLTGIIITVAIEILAHFKRQLLNWLFNSESGQTHVHTAIPVITWTAMNFVLVFIAGLLCSYISPVAAGSGIPQIKCFLNGVKVPKVIRLKTYLVKTVGIVLAVVGGLACGKEGPMVHAGAVIAGGISQGSDIFLLMNFSWSI